MQEEAGVVCFVICQEQKGGGLIGPCFFSRTLSSLLFALIVQLFGKLFCFAKEGTLL